MSKVKNFLKDSRIALIAAPLILLAPVYLTGKAFYWGTPGTQFVPWWEFAWKSILSGESPLWNPLLGMGAPLAANYQSALFYPPTWIYFLAYLVGGISFMAWMISILVCGHLIWAGWGTAALLKELGANRFGQTIAGLAFSLSGYLVARAGFLSINAAAAWIPWLLVMVLQNTKKSKGSFVRLVAVLSMLLLAGHAQTAFYGILLGGMWSVYWSLAAARKGSKLLVLGQTSVQYLAAGLWAAAIGAVQLLPTAQYLLFSQRAVEYGYEQAMTYSFWPWRFLTLGLPNLFGNPAIGSYWGYGNFWEDAVYIGLFPLLLALGFWLKPASRKTVRAGRKGTQTPGLGFFLGGITLLGFVLALGKNTPIFPFLYQNLPGADIFQAPTRLSILAVSSLAIVAGLGAHRLSKPVGKRLYFTRLAVAGCAAIILGAVLTGTMVEDLKGSFFQAAAWAGVIGLGSAVLLLLMPGAEEDQRRNIWQWAVILLICLDLIRAGWGLNPGVEVDFYQVDQEEKNGRVWMPADIEYDLKFNRFFRFDSFQPELDWEAMHEVLLPNLAMLQGIEMVNNFDPLVPGTFQAWMDAVNQNIPDQAAMQLMNITGLIDQTPQGLIRIIPQNAEPDPVFLAGCAAVRSPAEVTPEMVLESDQNFLDNLLIVSEEDIECAQGSSGTVKVLEQRNGSLRLETNLERGSWVFWSQTWYPGWVYLVDGEQVGPTYRANYLFQAVPVPAGAKEIRLVYRPQVVIWGAVLSCVSLFALGVLGKKK